MRASDLNPDVALKALLKDVGVDVYEYASQPNTVKANSFISMRSNGIINSLTKPQGVYNGNIALRIHCRMYPDNTANVIETRRLARLCDDLVNCKVSGEYYFELDTLNPITDINPNPTSGYSEYLLNVAWRTPA